MLITPYSLLSAVLWSSVFILLLFFCRKSTRFLAMTGVVPLLLLIAGVALRCVLPVEIPYVTQPLGLRGPVTQLFAFFKQPLGTITVGDGLLILWAAGSLILLGRFLIRYRRFWKRLRIYEPLDTPFILKAARQVAAEQKTPMPQLFQTRSVDTPLVAGLLRPVLLLPDFGYTPEEYYYIFLHELTHWKNHDLWVKLFIELLCGVFWWNPLVYLLKHNLSLTLELKCDAAVLRDRDAAEAGMYQSVLLKTLACGLEQRREVFTPFTVTELAVPDKQAILQRLELMDAHTHTGLYRLVLWGFGILLALLLALSYTFVIQPVFDPPLKDITGVWGVYQPLTAGNSWMKLDECGTYWLFAPGQYYPSRLSQEAAQMLLDSGIPLRDSAETS